MYIDFNKIDGYEDNNESKYLTLISADKNKGAIKRCKEIRNIIKYLLSQRTMVQAIRMINT